MARRAIIATSIAWRFLRRDDDGGKRQVNSSRQVTEKRNHEKHERHEEKKESEKRITEKTSGDVILRARFVRSKNLPTVLIKNILNRKEREDLF